MGPTQACPICGEWPKPGEICSNVRCTRARARASDPSPAPGIPVHPQLIKDLAHEVAIIRQEVERSRTELLDRIDTVQRPGTAGEGVLLGGLAGWLTVFTAAALSFSLIMALALSVDVWAGALIVAAGLAALGLTVLVLERRLGIDVARTVVERLRIGAAAPAAGGDDHRRRARVLPGLRPAAPARPDGDGLNHDHELTGTVAYVGRAESRRFGPTRVVDVEILEGQNIVVDFGGVRAVNDVSIRLEPGQRLGIVGANGAGKTTLFNALTGFAPLHGGRVILGNQEITSWPSFVRARAGLRRTFQKPRLSDTLTVEQNIGVGYRDVSSAEWSDRVEFLLERFELTPLRGVPVGALPFGRRREVEVLRALARVPHVLMLDEPASGLEGSEMESLLKVLMELQEEEGWGLMVIEHDLQFITTVAERLMVMEDGILLMEGATHDVLTDRRVRRIYLGEAVGA
jgi:branched-chain amino acid transport system ATP-binding protein